MKNRGPDLAHGSWFLGEAVLPPVSYLEVGTELPRPASPKGESVRRVTSVVLFITSTSGNDNPSAVAFGGRSLGGAGGPCQTEGAWRHGTRLGLAAASSSARVRRQRDSGAFTLWYCNRRAVRRDLGMGDPALG